MSEYQQKNNLDNLDNVLVDLKQKKQDKKEFDETEKKNYGELVQSFSKSVKDKLKDLKEGDITPELKSQIESRLDNLDIGLETLSLEQTIDKIEEIKQVLNMQIAIVGNTAIKNVEQLVYNTNFSTELSKLSEIIKETEEAKNEPKQDTNVTTLFEPIKKEEPKKIFSNDNVEKVAEEAKTFLGKSWDWMKNAGGKVKNVVRSPVGLAAGLGIGAISIFSKKFRRGVGKVIGAPFKAVGGLFRGIGNVIAAPFGWIGAKLNGQKYDFKLGAYDKEQGKEKEIITQDNQPPSPVEVVEKVVEGVKEEVVEDGK